MNTYAKLAIAAAAVAVVAVVGINLLPAADGVGRPARRRLAVPITRADTELDRDRIASADRRSFHLRVRSRPAGTR